MKTRPTTVLGAVITALVMLMVMDLCGVLLAAQGSRVLTSAAHGFSLRLPTAYACSQGRYDAQDYASVDFLRRELAYPELREADTSIMKDERGETFRLDDAANAVTVRGPYGTYAVVFAAGSAFPAIDEIQRRLLEQVHLEAVAGGRKADDLMQMSVGEYTLSGLPALSLTLKRPVPDTARGRTDTLFTEILTARSGSHVYGVIMRGPEWMGRDAKTMIRQIFLSIVYGLTIAILPTDMVSRVIDGTRVRCEFPSAWTKVFEKKVPFPVPLGDFTPSSSTGGRTDDSNRRESSVLVVQTPTFQCEFFVTGLPDLDSAAWARTSSRIFDRVQPASAQEPLETRPSALAHLDAYERSHSVFRRNDNVRTSWIACRLGAQLLLVRVVAWQREVTAAIPVHDIIARCGVVP
ncbi:MAG: hypothetical protein ACKO9V_00600 [Candidatus Kapaibacterium sp.]